MNTYLLLETVEDMVSPLMFGTKDEIIDMIVKQSMKLKECKSTEQEVRDYYNANWIESELSVMTDAKNNQPFGIWEDSNTLEEFNSTIHNKGIQLLYRVYKMDDIKTMQSMLV